MVNGQGVRGGVRRPWQPCPAGLPGTSVDWAPQKPCSPAELCWLPARVSGAENTGHVFTILVILEGAC